MWEMFFGVAAFNNIPHDFGLSLDICQGLRPEIVISNESLDDDEQDTEAEYIELMKRCWDSDPDKRPTVDEICKCFDSWNNKHPYNNERIPIPENKPITQNNHPSTCYTSRKIDYSAKLNEILNQGELSSIIVTDNNRTMLTEDLECCKISSSKIDSVQEFNDEETKFDEYQI
ncbi:hypothetical protein RhiirA4_476875 [Rhizophagus irregularis]|uniref:Serine-threonine/tyrosine-protein kinase catalytic domain-containing protein n=1 Tax=Rhizophagus irregularis TaxID=588596 RepID=A0A2I1HCD7_9GLOM|nr:hypothetical protein RhiirA4_476875 [Rhizophagus irregularis]